MADPARIQITVNGQAVCTLDQISLPDFLQSQQIRPDRVVVEWNGQAQTRTESARTRLSQGDVLEVIRIVAGG